MKKRITSLLLSTGLCLSCTGLPCIYAYASTSEETAGSTSYEIQGNSIIFGNYPGNATVSYIINSTEEYDMQLERKSAAFTPKEDGTYVLSVEEYTEEIISAGASDSGHFHYFYPVLTNYSVQVTDGKISIEKDGSRSWYSSEQIQKEIESTTDMEVVCYDVTAENSDYLSDGQYFSYVNGHMPLNRYGSSNIYITTHHGLYATESYFCTISDYNDIPAISDESLAQLQDKQYTSSWADGNLMISTADEMVFNKIKALKDGQVSVTACDRQYDLVIQDSIFHIADVEKFDWLPHSISEFNAFKEQYGIVSIHGNYIVYCEDVNYSTGEEVIFEQLGTAELKEVTRYDIDTDPAVTPVGSASHTVIVYEAVSPGTVKVIWSQGRIWETPSIVKKALKYYEAGEDLSITEIEEHEFIEPVPGDVSGDGSCNTADAVMLQKWLLGKGEMTCPQNADICKDGKVNVFDLCLLKKVLLFQSFWDTPENNETNQTNAEKIGAYALSQLENGTYTLETKIRSVNAENQMDAEIAAIWKESPFIYLSFVDAHTVLLEMNGGLLDANGYLITDGTVSYEIGSVSVPGEGFDGDAVEVEWAEGNLYYFHAGT